MRSALQRPPLWQTGTCLQSQPRPAAFASRARPGYSSSMPTLSSALAVGSLPLGSHQAVPEVRTLPDLDLQVVLMMVVVPSFTCSELVPGIPSLCQYFRICRGLPFPTHSLGHLPATMLEQDLSLQQHTHPPFGGGKRSGPMQRCW